MKTKNGFTLFSLPEFEHWLAGLQVKRTIKTIQQHHTWSPHYGLCKPDNQFEMCTNMRHFHITERGWADIGQHFTTFPDGSIISGRNLEKTPSCIFGNNSGSICIEHVGNFDKNKDQMTDAHRQTIIGMTAALCKRFNLPPTDQHIVYHHWFDLKTGARNNGSGNNKSCPGTGFFGGNSVQSARQHFLPLVAAAMQGSPHKPATKILQYAQVMADSLAVRKGPGISFGKTGVVFKGAVLRVYEKRDSWYKIAQSNDEWVSGKHTIDIRFGIINASSLNVRSGPGPSFPVVEKMLQNEEVPLYAKKNDWYKISASEKWVSAQHVREG